MITATILLVGGLSGSCGITIGCLMRQPEINKLRKMVKQLNKKNSELRKLLDEQMQMIEVLQDEIRAYKFYMNILVRQSRQSGLSRATIPDERAIRNVMPRKALYMSRHMVSLYA